VELARRDEHKFKYPVAILINRNKVCDQIGRRIHFAVFLLRNVRERSEVSRCGNWDTEWVVRGSISRWGERLYSEKSRPARELLQHPTQ
jgi:hypothetical protein